MVEKCNFDLHDQECFACGVSNAQGLHLIFNSDVAGKASAAFTPKKHHQSYANTFHGGLQTVLLDSCMVQALRTIGIVAKTSKLEVRFKDQIELEQEICIVATVVQQKSLFFMVEAQLTQNGIIKTTSHGIFRNCL